MSIISASKTFSSISSQFLKNTAVLSQFLSCKIHTSGVNHEWNVNHLIKPDPMYHNCRRRIYFPEKYTVEPLKNDHLAGRDPVTRRVVTARIGGGIKHLFHWVDNKRTGPKTPNEFHVEKVIQIMTCGCRTAHIALVGGENHLRYILATINMKAGDLIRTSQYIPPEAYVANDGDAFPLGALSLGTMVHNVERLPGEGGTYLTAAGVFGVILRKINRRVIVKFPSKLEVSFPQECMATVGQLSNAEQASIPLGNHSKLRESGRRPKSGFVQKKTGRFGRKIKPPPPVQVMKPLEDPKIVYKRVVLPQVKIKYPEGYVESGSRRVKLKYPKNYE